jgi:signal transduction histidine kinase
VRRAGVHIDWTIDGPLTAVPDTVGLALYRIVQESLSNVSRHAPGAAVSVTVTVTAQAVEVLVANDAGTGGAPVGSSDGSGISGMRARAESIGGMLAAGPRSEGGFQVYARLPILVAEGTVEAPAATDLPGARN